MLKAGLSTSSSGSRHPGRLNLAVCFPSILLALAQAKAEFADYYRNSLRYLACVDIEKDLTAAERIERAHDLGIAALLGQSIYNFGELVRQALPAP